MAFISVVSISASGELIRSVEDQFSPSIKGGIPVKVVYAAQNIPPHGHPTVKHLDYPH